MKPLTVKEIREREKDLKKRHRKTFDEIDSIYAKIFNPLIQRARALLRNKQ